MSCNCKKTTCTDEPHVCPETRDGCPDTLGTDCVLYNGTTIECTDAETLYPGVTHKVIEEADDAVLTDALVNINTQLCYIFSKDYIKKSLELIRDDTGTLITKFCEIACSCDCIPAVFFNCDDIVPTITQTYNSINISLNNLTQATSVEFKLKQGATLIGTVTDTTQTYSAAFTGLTEVTDYTIEVVLINNEGGTVVRSDDEEQLGVPCTYEVTTDSRDVTYKLFVRNCSSCIPAQTATLGVKLLQAAPAMTIYNDLSSPLTHLTNQQVMTAVPVTVTGGTSPNGVLEIRNPNSFPVYWKFSIYEDGGSMCPGSTTMPNYSLVAPGQTAALPFTLNFGTTPDNYNIVISICSCPIGGMFGDIPCQSCPDWE